MKEIKELVRDLCDKFSPTWLAAKLEVREITAIRWLDNKKFHPTKPFHSKIKKLHKRHIK